jgi:hypothetical protein
MTLRALVVLTAVLMLIVSCRSTKDTASEMKEEAKIERPPDPGPGVPPGHCRIVGTIVSVDPVSSGDANDPCSKAPCSATVKVDEVIGYGSGFTASLGKGSEIKVYFQYTLNPSGESFPGMSPALPGLKQGSRFQADLRSGATMADTKQAYAVGQYMAR